MQDLGSQASIYDLLRFERLLSDLAASFINLPPENVDLAIENELERIVLALGIDRSALVRVMPHRTHAEVTHSYATGDSGTPGWSSAQPLTPWALDMLAASRPIVFERLDDLPPQASEAREAYRLAGLRSSVTMPIVIADKLYGGLSFDSVHTERSWSDPLLGRMRVLAEVFGNALARKFAQEDLALATGLERLATSALASFLLAAPGAEGATVAVGLSQLGEFVGADQVTLWQMLQGASAFAVTQRWQGDHFAGLPNDEVHRLLPWTSARVAGGDIVRLARIADLPVEAGTDRETLEELGIRSLLVVPSVVSGKVPGALCVASAEAREWPDAFTPGVRLLAEVYATVDARLFAERRRWAAELEAAHWRERLAHLVRVHTAGEMSVALAHEITQPLGAIENYALAVRNRSAKVPPDIHRIHELIDKVIGQATRAGDVIARMRSMAQRHEPEIKPISVAQAVDQCVSMIKLDCEARNIDVIVESESGLPLAMTDEVHVQQVILSLLRNAIEAIEMAKRREPVREIRVSVKRSDDDGIAVAVTDTGVGIPEGFLERIFESFYSTKANGLGVGLAISRKLIEMYGGTLWASHHARQGAQFCFTLPVAEME
ncbi:ATP-binding protein [Variovorax sp. J22R24]|uniref:ATP-binding protein n=1 Tax=Variovorax gracilis TaxID=3053502 RepID=UPI00257637E7|nr:ATP-binding protein [Variovorax sp. J22R24]MDM0106324.1 ATP-binding protein [Variovorax sp. J22R24]